MKKYYDEREIWKKLMEELSEFDIDHELYYSITDNGFCFYEYISGLDDCDIERIERIFNYQEYENIDMIDIYTIEKIASCIKNNNLYNDMAVARDNYMQYIFSIPYTCDPEEDKVNKLSNKFQCAAELYLWFKYIFAEVVKTFRKILNEYATTINGIYEFI